MLARAPFISVVLCFISGILLADWLMSFFDINQFVFIGLALLLGVISFVFYFKNAKTAFGVSFSLFLLLVAAYCKVSAEEKRTGEINSLQNIRYSAYEAEIRSLPEKRRRSLRLEATVTRILSDTHWVDTDIHSLISIDAESDVIPKPGDRIVVRGNLERPLEALNPAQFDYRQYLRNKGILWTDYLRSGSFQVITIVEQQNNPVVWSIQISQWADQKFREHIRGDKAYGLVKAMLLGRRDDLGTDQVDDYVASGTVHILSVSGMHVAIIFLVISFLLGWVKRWKYGRFVYLFLVILLLGFYAVATGLPPSVQRATLMCIVFVIAEVFSRKHQAMNTLAVSAFLILLFDPSALYDVGFQLSYLAMSGIFLLYEPILSIYNPENLGNPGNRVLKYLWQVTALSLAAQLATFPLSLYYFHQFPTYFWLVNPFVILFTNILLPAAIVLLLVSTIHVIWIQWLVGKVVEITAWLTDFSVAVPKLLPGYLIENLHLGLLEVVFLYVLLLMIWYACFAKEYSYLKYAFAVSALFVTHSVCMSLITYTDHDSVAHRVPKHAVISFKHGRTLYIACDSGFPADRGAYDFYIKNYAVSKEIGDVVFVVPKAN
ncbi:MAG: ComEC/Rec2 family competence protein [Dyadobacter sp.]|uniref:ComEC/Rec2 family competence protein n=1 Tax=Dyadobacter sp. TaxID=1914288 RepID=UPI0032650759